MNRLFLVKSKAPAIRYSRFRLSSIFVWCSSLLLSSAVSDTLSTVMFVNILLEYFFYIANIIQFVKFNDIRAVYIITEKKNDKENMFFLKDLIRSLKFPIRHLAWFFELAEMRFASSIYPNLDNGIQIFSSTISLNVECSRRNIGKRSDLSQSHNMSNNFTP